jgi:hypothetical protein
MQQFLKAAYHAVLTGALGLGLICGFCDRQALGQIGTSPVKKESNLTKGGHGRIKPKPKPPEPEPTRKPPAYLGPPISVPPFHPATTIRPRYLGPPIRFAPGDPPRLRMPGLKTITTRPSREPAPRPPIQIHPTPMPPTPMPPTPAPNPIPPKTGGQPCCCGMQGGGFGFGGFGGGFGGWEFGGGFGGLQGGGLGLGGLQGGGQGLGGYGSNGNGGSGGSGLMAIAGIVEAMVMAAKPANNSPPATSGSQPDGGSPDAGSYSDAGTNNGPASSPDCTYYQDTGHMVCTGPDGGQISGQGYSGTDAGLNNPADECTPFVGPIPTGDYSIGDATNTRGPNTLPLTPMPGTDTCGRDAFRVHGDNSQQNYTASQGCVIMPPNVRAFIDNNNDDGAVLHVFANEFPDGGTAPDGGSALDGGTAGNITPDGGTPPGSGSAPDGGLP